MNPPPPRIENHWTRLTGQPKDLPFDWDYKYEPLHLALFVVGSEVWIQVNTIPGPLWFLLMSVLTDEETEKSPPCPLVANAPRILCSENRPGGASAASHADVFYSVVEF